MPTPTPETPNAPRRALLSVYDKTGLTALGAGLVQRGFQLVASGGTARALRDSGLGVLDVSTLTGSAEVLGGRVKTLHPAIHAGILSRRTPADAAELAGLNAAPIDVVVCNLYPFEETIAQADVTEPACIEEIDIGGVTLLRAAAKNHRHVSVVCAPSFYNDLLAGLDAGGPALEALNRGMAKAAFRATARYDMAISGWLSDSDASTTAATTTASALSPGDLKVGPTKLQDLRYGENPHQQAALYTRQGQTVDFELLGGKALSYNNLVDMDAARAACADFAGPTVVIVKHTNPCGLATAGAVVAAFHKALASDPISAFGSIIAVNRTVDVDLLDAIGTLFIEVIVASSFTEAALERLAAKKKNCRVIRAPMTADARPQLRPIQGGVLVQSADVLPVDRGAWQVVSARQPTDAELKDLSFAWQVVKHVKSNAIVFCRDEATIGVGAGQMNRVDAVFLAARRAGERGQGTVMASDAFFPFPDGIEEAAKAGVTAVIQPGGSIRDSSVIEAVNRLGLAMITTGRRHFKH